MTFSKGLRARTGSRQEQLFADTDFRLLLEVFPIWLVKMSDIHDVLPLSRGLFDLAIVDEATQCDIASTLPVLQRARRAVITGDPAQLRHISFLSRLRQRELPSGILAAAGKSHDLLVGTAHSFQGEERDIMLLSLAVDPASPHPAIRFLEREDVFNVAITRARLQQHVYCSLDAGDLPGNSLLAAYLLDVETRIAGLETGAPPAAGGETADRFAREAAAGLKSRGCEVLTAHPVAGLKMDLLASRGGMSAGIDLVGYPGAFEAAFPIERLKMFHRAGLHILPIPYSRWVIDPEACLAAVERALAENGRV